ncbi:putative CRISPR-associated protein [Fontivita pretiosa]|uniref:putative CRISPR-associated protein n=1 Tax=Fontivita pretiosa TaxID=2989684 RepID=UPI003D17B525
MMKKRRILICTVGTSLFKPNLEGLPTPDGYTAWAEKTRKQGELDPPSLDAVNTLRAAFAKKDLRVISATLLRLSPAARICGAEVNSIASMIDKNYVPPDCGLFFLHSDTDDGRSIAAILKSYYDSRGHSPVETILVPDLQDQDPKRFRTKGLRNLARKICGVIRDYSPAACAINATGGYKAQIAMGVLLGQAIGVPVYYKHELFSEIIAFPPMPVALDFEVWMRASGMLYDLEGASEPIAAALYDDEWDEKYESLIERVPIDGQDYLELSPTGQIFHDTFRERFRTARDQVLPPPVPPGQKRPPRLEDAGWPGRHPQVERFLKHVTDDVPQVVHCATFYFNPDLAERTRFRLGSDGIEGVYSDGSFTVKFRVETSAQTPGQQAAVVAALNEWLSGRA